MYIIFKNFVKFIIDFKIWNIIKIFVIILVIIRFVWYVYLDD